MSGFPGILFQFFRYRYPLCHSAFLSTISGFVSFARMCDIFLLARKIIKAIAIQTNEL